MATTYEKYLECNIIQDVLFKEQAANIEYLNALEMKLNALNLNSNTTDTARNTVVTKIDEVKSKISEFAEDIETVNTARRTILGEMVTTDLQISLNYQF